MAGLVTRSEFCIVPIMWLSEQKPSVYLGGLRQGALHRNGFAGIQPDAAAGDFQETNQISSVRPRGRNTLPSLDSSDKMELVASSHGR